MATVRYLIDYLPQYMQEFVEMQKIMTAEQPEFDDGHDAVLTVWNNQFLTDCNAAGVERWEKILGITPKETDTLAERKFRIYSKWNQELPYTYTKLAETLTTLCGSGNYSISLTANSYYIEIKLALTNKSQYDDVEAILKKMVPANMTTHIQIMYNSHQVLHAYTHSELGEYTHYQLRNEVITQ